MKYPSRIVCLTEETTETLYLLGEGDRVVGVSGYTVRPPEARQKPRVSAFINARFEKIEALRPHLILAFSDLQADIAAELARRGFNVVLFNQRSVAEILQMIRMLGGLIDAIRTQPAAPAGAARNQALMNNTLLAGLIVAMLVCAAIVVIAAAVRVSNRLKGEPTPRRAFEPVIAE